MFKRYYESPFPSEIINYHLEQASVLNAGFPFHKIFKKHGYWHLEQLMKGIGKNRIIISAANPKITIDWIPGIRTLFMLAVILFFLILGLGCWFGANDLRMLPLSGGVILFVVLMFWFMFSLDAKRAENTLINRCKIPMQRIKKSK